MSFGYGQVGYGRAEVGQAKSSIELRLEDPTPPDESVGWFAYDTVIKLQMYGFSSRVQDDNFFLIEVSEDDGAYVDVYRLKTFSSPYDGAGSRIDFHQADPQRCTMYIQRTSFFPTNTLFKFKVTARDGFGVTATEEVPVKWE